MPDRPAIEYFCPGWPRQGPQARINTDAGYDNVWAASQATLFPPKHPSALPTLSKICECRTQFERQNIDFSVTSSYASYLTTRPDSQPPRTPHGVLHSFQPRNHEVFRFPDFSISTRRSRAYPVYRARGLWYRPVFFGHLGGRRVRRQPNRRIRWPASWPGSRFQSRSTPCETGRLLPRSPFFQADTEMSMVPKFLKEGR